MTTSPAFSNAFAKEAFNVEALPQVWVIEQQPGSVWTPDAPLSGLWTADPQPHHLWHIQIDNSQRRITEAGHLRLTEQGIIRIVRRGRRGNWQRDPSSSAEWRTSNA